MSRSARSPSPCPRALEVSIEPELVRVNGPRGELTERVSRDIDVKQEDGELLVDPPDRPREHRALHGLTRALVANMVEGVTGGYEKGLEIQGVGYRARSRAATSSSRWATRMRCRSRPPTASSSRCRSRRESIVQGISQAGRRRDRRQHSQAAAAGALQGQGHPLRGRVRGPEGRQARMTSPYEESAAPPAPPPRAREGRGTAERPRISVFRSNRGIAAQLVDDAPGKRSPPSAGPRPTCASSSRWSRPSKAGKLLAERAKATGVDAACSTAAATGITAE